jgi:hypothetical protein
MKTLARAALISIVLALPLTARAQALDPGTSVRVWGARPQHGNGTLSVITADRDTIVMRRRLKATPDSVLRVPISSIRRLEIQVPRTRGGGAAHGAKRGLALGALAGLAYGVAQATDNTCPEGGACSGVMIWFGPPIGAFYGLLIGTPLGAVFPGRKWECAVGAACEPEKNLRPPPPSRR